MDNNMAELRSCLFGNDKEEVLRFRQVVVNIVLATDIFDKELNDLRKSRWTKAFSECAAAGGNNHLRATIVLEHIMQASDVSHTMQHWYVLQMLAIVNVQLFLMPACLSCCAPWQAYLSKMEQVSTLVAPITATINDANSMIFCWIFTLVLILMVQMFIL